MTFQDNETAALNERTVHLLFEQSGTFKHEFIKFGYKAYDYDICNEYGETDFQIDLFFEIEKAYQEKNSVFDEFKNEDLLMAFFPCVRFENQILMSFQGVRHGMDKWTLKEKMTYCIELMDELKHYYDLINKLFIVCINKKLQLIVENPYSEQHFLKRYWCFKPSIIDMDRRESGDYYKKPTQYWFLNREPKNNFIFEPQNYNRVGDYDPIRRMTKTIANKVGANTIKEARSMIHPDYANRFIREFILDSEGRL